jgi:hypothetical protein
MANVGLEVFTLREGTTLRLVSRLHPRWMLSALGLVLVIAAGAVSLVDVGPRPTRLECARAGDRCTLSIGSRTTREFPVSGTLRFEVRSAGRQWELVAVTEEESVRLLWGSRREVDARADELNRFLKDPAQDRYELEHDPRTRLLQTQLRLLPGIAGLVAVIMLLISRDKVTLFDRAQGVAARRLPLFPSTRRLERFRAVAVRALGDEREPWYMRSSANRRGGPWRRIVLVEAAGTSWWVTPYQNQQYAASSDLEAVAADLARYLGLPLAARGNAAPPMRT